jgi:hypothetical protein
MSQERKPWGILDVLDTFYQYLLLAGSIALAVTKTPLSFWLPALAVLIAAFAYSFSRRGRGHWPSTIFGILELIYIAAVIAFLRADGASVDDLVSHGIGLLVIHSLLYLLAARSFLGASAQSKREQPNKAPEPTP